MMGRRNSHCFWLSDSTPAPAFGTTTMLLAGNIIREMVDEKNGEINVKFCGSEE